MRHIDEDTNEVRSLEVRQISTLFEETTFPITTEDIVEEFGMVNIEYPRRSDPLRSILETSGYETYESRNELELAILNGVRRDAVGRARYSDRGDEVSEEFNHMEQSF